MHSDYILELFRHNPAFFRPDNVDGLHVVPIYSFDPERNRWTIWKQPNQPVPFKVIRGHITRALIASGRKFNGGDMAMAVELVETLCNPDGWGDRRLIGRDFTTPHGSR